MTDIVLGSFIIPETKEGRRRYGELEKEHEKLLKEMQPRKGKFAVSVSNHNKWINYADLSNDKDNVILNGLLEHAKEYATLHKQAVVVFIADKEYEINP